MIRLLFCTADRCLLLATVARSTTVMPAMMVNEKTRMQAPLPSVAGIAPQVARAQDAPSHA
jgi:hypothetical protein